eukprot:TRINITY_DN31293_c0_g1_i1.p1 TRINITY_DN31293_c0_g1~~TRINITY_DN31293_c0_g1_i1.p1  ORF type:complete len:141 (-),score=2.29 TRINITY_DN31293_c0_g1_i1:139-561(-)
MAIFAYVSGALFAAAWWVFIDGTVSSGVKYDFVMWLPGIIGTAGFFMINSTKPAQLTGGDGGFLGEGGGSNKFRVWFFLSVLVSFLAVIAAVWIKLDYGKVKNDWSQHPWTGTSLIIQSAILIISAFCFWGARYRPSDDF